MAGRITQLPVEVLRARGADAVARVAQVYVEVLTPYVPSDEKSKSASQSFTLTASAAHPTVVAAPSLYAKSASQSFTLTPAAAISSVGHAPAKSAAASLVLTPTAAIVAVTHDIPRSASASFVLTATATAVKTLTEPSAEVRIVFRARARVKVPEVVFGESYVGRYQVGGEVPLWAIVLDSRGSPLAPTTTPPVATIYNLDLGTRVEAAELPKLRGSRVGPTHARPLALGVGYAPGRYGILYRSATGGFVGLTLATFEVAAGGDARGPVQAAHAVDHPSGRQFLEHTGSGALLTGRRPRVD